MATLDPRLKLDATSVVCKEAKLQGDISIGPGTVVHPAATIIAHEGTRIIIGENNIIEEYTQIICIGM